MTFDNFKSNTSHILKRLGDIGFIKKFISNDEIQTYFDNGDTKEAFYLLATLDYVSRINNVPLCNKFDSIRKYKLKEPLFPKGLLLLEHYTKKDLKTTAIEHAIPEFLRFNIIEEDVRNSV